MADEIIFKPTLFKNFRLLTMQRSSIPYGMIEASRENRSSPTEEHPANGCVLVIDSKIAWIGAKDVRSDTELKELIALFRKDGVGTDHNAIELEGLKVIDGRGLFLSPGLIDCHTHLVYGGNRADEWQQRLCGTPYELIAKQGGGILSTVRATRAASEDELVDEAAERVAKFIRQGVTTVEIKSGYGLDLTTELKMLRAARRIGSTLPISVTTTLLAAHAVPPEYQGRSDDYIDFVCRELIPAAVGLCEAVDVFCETIAFNLHQTERVLRVAADHGLSIKVHAEQLSHTGAAVRAARLGALSVDHLECLSPEDCDELAKYKAIATLLPGAFYNLKETRKPPVSALRAADVGIAIASDSNPGSSPVGSILLMAHMACTFFGMTPEETIRGLTMNAALAIGQGDSIGTLEIGKRADFALWKVRSPTELAYGIGHNPCVGVYRSGELVFDNSPQQGKR